MLLGWVRMKLLQKKENKPMVLIKRDTNGIALLVMSLFSFPFSILYITSKIEL